MGEIPGFDGSEVSVFWSESNYNGSPQYQVEKIEVTVRKGSTCKYRKSGKEFRVKRFIVVRLMETSLTNFKVNP